MMRLMNNGPGTPNLPEFLRDTVLPAIIQDCPHSALAVGSDLDRLYHAALARLVEALIDLTQRPSTAEPRPSVTRNDPLVEGVLGAVGPLDSRDIGLAYEYLRGFRLQFDKSGNPTLAPSPGTRRNQGLFYTPQAIVGYIVANALDALEIADPTDYLDLRIADPAAGAGVFLAEALEQIARRAVVAEGNGARGPESRISAIKEAWEDESRAFGLNMDLPDNVAIRLHVLQACVHGVDLDEIALRIARAFLLERALGEFPMIPGIEPNLVAGNALVGEICGGPESLAEDRADRRHFVAYCGREPADEDDIPRWRSKTRPVHWPVQFPGICGPGGRGFDLILGNPPYEVLSARESGISERRREQSYFRRTYRTCRGKINTYRVMLERGLALLRDGGVLGFIMPATLLADSTARDLRSMMLEESDVIRTVVIPESARVFEGVTQALLILVTRKGKPTKAVTPVFWNGSGSIDHSGGIEISSELIRKTGRRIPLLRSRKEKELLEILAVSPPLAGNKDIPPAGTIHQGEINLTVHREFVTATPTSRPLIRGEHIIPFAVLHPCSPRQRLDWLAPDFPPLNTLAAGTSLQALGESRAGRSPRGRPWLRPRIVLARVVNMATFRRLKAAAVPAGWFLGDMTNYIDNMTVPCDYLLGLLNSRLLNWRLRITSTNNYISAAEIEALPIPRPFPEERDERIMSLGLRMIDDLLGGPSESCAELVRDLNRLLLPRPPEQAALLLASMIEAFAGHFRDRSTASACPDKIDPRALSLLDAFVLKLYGAESYIDVVDGSAPTGEECYGAVKDI